MREMTIIDKVWKLLGDVYDPEVPVLSIIDLGVLRSVKEEDGKIVVEITSTYSGCPATDVFIQKIKEKLAENGIKNVEVRMKYNPPWTTDWITDEGKDKLREYGIAPPVDEPDKTVLFAKPFTVPCPKCNSENTKLVSQFGSTACKALYHCLDCKEPFEYFKCLK